MSSQTRPAKNSLMNRWLKKRMPAQKQQTLTQRSTFIFPSRFGIAYLFVALFLYTLGTNYQNNLILLLSFTLGGFFITSIIYSYANLNGLTVKSGHYDSVYAGQNIALPIYLSNSLNRNLLNFQFSDHGVATLTLGRDPDAISVPFTPAHRGAVNPGRLTISSHFPLGLLRCWTHLDLDIELLVFPAPVESEIPLLALEDDNTQPADKSDEQEDFAGIKEHVQGESLSRISWKHVARNQQRLVSKHFKEGDRHPMWLSIHQCREKDQELRLSKLTFAVNYYSQQNALFGLELHNNRIPPGSGEAHRLACLRALALC